MKLLIILFGLFMLIMAGLMMLWPRKFTSYMLKQASETWLYISAIAVRLALGAVLILYADQSRHPLALQIIGAIAVIAGVVLIFVTKPKFQNLIQWAFGRLGKYMRAVACFAILFGGYLIYAVT